MVLSALAISSTDAQTRTPTAQEVATIRNYTVHQHVCRQYQSRHGELLPRRMGDLGQSPQRELQESDGRAG